MNTAHADTQHSSRPAHAWRFIRDRLKGIPVSNWVCIAPVLIFVYLVIRNTSGGTNPVVLADEWTYSTFSRLRPLADSPFSGYLYLSLYKATNLFGDGFLPAARIINSLFFAAAFPFIYNIGRQFTTAWPALWIATLSLMLPLNTYTAYYMPEAMYFLFFWILAWMLLAAGFKTEWMRFLCAGAFTGLGMLIKFHAFFLLPPMVVFAMLQTYPAARRIAWRNNFACALALVAAAFATRYIVGIFLTGNIRLNFLGSSYQGMAESGAGHMLHLMPAALHSLKGHFFSMCLLFGTLIVPALLGRVRDPGMAEKYTRLRWWALLTIVFLIGITAFFTAISVSHGPYESANRLHMRYYNFCFPLLLLMLAPRFEVAKAARFAIPVITLIIICMPFALGIRQFIPVFTDSPEMTGLFANRLLLYIYLGTGCALTFLLMACAKKWRVVILGLYLPFFIAFTAWQTTKITLSAMSGNQYTRGAFFAKNYLRGEVSRLTVVGESLAGLYTAAFCIDNCDLRFFQVHKAQPLDKLDPGIGREWVLAFDDIIQAPGDAHVVRNAEFALYNVSKSLRVDFGKPAWPGIVSQKEGLSHPEAWGTWSVSERLELKFEKPLPKKFMLEFKAMAFQSNIGLDFVLDIGGVQNRFSFADKYPKTFAFQYELPGQSDTLSITIPAPDSPSRLGIGSDSRPLGIGMFELRIHKID